MNYSYAKGLPPPFIFQNIVLGEIFGEFGEKSQIISETINIKPSLEIQVSYKFKFNQIYFF